MRVLLICDDFYHPGKVPIAGVEPLKSKGFEIDIISNANDFKVEMLQNYPVVLLSKCDEVTQEDKSPWKTPAIQQAFVDYVEKGGGLLAIHTALVAGENTELLDKLIGSRFAWHPQDCLTTVQPIKPHPITDGVEMFCVMDEHYRLDIIADDVDILVASYSPPQGVAEKYEEEPYTNTTAWIGAACYVRTQGDGRVCVLTPGHTIEVWNNDQFQKLLGNALRWCSGVKG